MYSRRRFISSKFWGVCVKARGWSLSLCIIETWSFAEPGVYPFCLTGWSSCSRNLPVCSAGVRFREVRCAVVPSVSRISYITALYFHHIHHSFLSLTPLRSTLISYPMLKSFISSLSFLKIIHKFNLFYLYLWVWSHSLEHCHPTRGHTAKQTDSYL